MDKCEFRFNDDFTVTPEIKQNFVQYGYIIVRGLLDKEELELITKATESPDDLKKKQCYSLNDPEQRPIDRVIWNHPGNDITGMLAISEKLAGTDAQVPNDAIKKCTVLTDITGKEFTTPGTNSYIIKPPEEQP